MTHHAEPARSLNDLGVYSELGTVGGVRGKASDPLNCCVMKRVQEASGRRWGIREDSATASRPGGVSGYHLAGEKGSGSAYTFSIVTVGLLTVCNRI